MTTYDFIVVGAGSAGSALAARLSENGRHTVLVLEAGGSDRSLWIQMPIGYGKVFYDARVNWKYVTEPVSGLGGQTSYWPRGKVIGGSGSINAMVYVRGHALDYDDWRTPGWAWSDIEPVFRRMEHWSGEACAHRGRDGPLSVCDISRLMHPICESWFTAAAESGLARNPDYNGAEFEGVGPYQITTRGGLRASAARCYLRPALARPNVDLIARAHVRRIVFEEGRAAGVEYTRREQRMRADARGAVILAAGAVNSPQLLQLSGIGPGDLLQANGIGTRVDAPEVGRNLQDHIGYDHLYECRMPTLNQMLGTLRGKLAAGIQFLVSRRGPLSLSVNHAGGFATLMPDSDRPDTQLYFSPLSYTKARPGTRPLLRPDPFPGFSLGANTCRPTSRGSIAIHSPDPEAPPRIQPNYFDTQEDCEGALAGARFLLRIASAKSMRDVIVRPLRPLGDEPSDETLMDDIRANAWTVFHPCGTCRMGSDASSVVDERLRVRGVEGLRVADASIFPAIPSGNINAPAIMVGERASDLIRSDFR